MAKDWNSCAGDIRSKHERRGPGGLRMTLVFGVGYETDLTGNRSLDRSDIGYLNVGVALDRAADQASDFRQRNR